MAKLFTIPAESRTETGKGYANRIRREGRVPAILYGPKAENRTLDVPANVVERLIASGAGGQIIDVAVGAEKHTVLIKEIQRDPARGDLVHIDFHKVDLDTELETNVPIVIVGEESRTSDGGFATQPVREILVACLPTNIPEQLEVDVSALEIGDTITVGEIVMPEGVRALEEPELAVATITLPEVETEETDDEAEEVEASDEEGEGEAESTEDED